MKVPAEICIVSTIADANAHLAAGWFYLNSVLDPERHEIIHVLGKKAPKKKAKKIRK